MEREKIQFPTNIPVELALRWIDGKDISGQYGDQVMFTTCDDRIMFVPPIVRKKIHEAGIEPGEHFEIVRAEKQSGQRKVIEWQVIRLQLEEPRPAVPSTVPPATVNEAPSKSTSPSNGSNNGHRLMQNASADSPIAGQGPELLRMALRAAIDQAQAAETYAKDRNYSLRFTSEDIRAIGLSLYIDAARNGNGGAQWKH